MASVDSLLSLFSLLPRAALKTLSHMSSQYEIMVGNLKTAHETAALPASFVNLYLDGNINNSPFDGNCNQVAHGYCSC